MPLENGFFTLLFADDTTLEYKHSCLNTLTNYVNRKLRSASEWFQANRLTLNAKKTKCILFSPKGISPPLPRNLKIDGTNIERIGHRFKVKSFKLVGINLDDKLNWGEHSQKVRNKLAMASYALARLKRSVPEYIKLNIFNSLFKCHLDYCLPIWGDCPASAKRGFLGLQKKALRNMANTKFNSHTDKLFNKYKILKYEDLVKLSKGLLMFKISLGLHPLNIINIFKRTNNFNRNLEFLLDLSPYKYLQKLIPTSLINNWNSLPMSFRNWLKENPENSKSKGTGANNSSKTDLVNNTNLFDFRIKGFINSFIQITTTNYKLNKICNNPKCNECNSN